MSRPISRRDGVKVHLDWRGGAAFCATTAGGHRIALDGPPEHGGKNGGARPMEAFLAGAAACSAFDVAHILRRGKQPLGALQVRAEAERAATEPKVFTRIHLHFLAAAAAGAAPGTKLSEAAVRRAAQLSVEKYCSALKMLSASCPVTFSCEMLADGEAGESQAADGAAGEEAE